MDWFQRLMGFAEATGAAGYESTRERLEVDGRQLKSRVNGRSYGVGELELASLQELRQRAQSAPPLPGRRNVSIVSGDVREMHAAPRYAGALFQVASQFNLLEMLGPEFTPEHGVTIYENDRTQGPACAIAAGAATVYRNYFAPAADGLGQDKSRQLDGFAELGTLLAQSVGKPAKSLWTMRNGYSMFARGAVDLMSAHIEALEEGERDALRQCLRIGLHWDVEVTGAASSPGPQVSQAFCSALPVSYNDGTGARAANWDRSAAGPVLHEALDDQGVGVPLELHRYAAVHRQAQPQVLQLPPAVLRPGLDGHGVCRWSLRLHGRQACPLVRALVQRRLTEQPQGHRLGHGLEPLAVAIHPVVGLCGVGRQGLVNRALDLAGSLGIGQPDSQRRVEVELPGGVLRQLVNSLQRRRRPTDLEASTVQALQEVHGRAGTTGVDLGCSHGRPSVHESRAHEAAQDLQVQVGRDAPGPIQDRQSDDAQVAYRDMGSPRLPDRARIRHV